MGTDAAGILHEIRNQVTINQVYSTMKTDDTQIAAPDLCHKCKHGGAVVERCNCPDLKAWVIMPRTLKNTLALSNAEAVAEGKGIKDYKPLPYAAVVAAAVNEKCKYYEPQQ